MERRISSASSIDLRPGAERAQLVVAEVGRAGAGREHEEVEGQRPPSTTSSRAATSTRATSAIRTSTFRWRRKIERIGVAIWAGLSAAVATW